MNRFVIPGILLLASCATSPVTETKLETPAYSKPTESLTYCGEVIGYPRLMKQYKTEDLDINIYEVNCLQALLDPSISSK